MVAAAISVIVRARRAGRVERQQIKWLAYGGAVAVGIIFVSGGISVWSETVSIAAISLELARIGWQRFAHDLAIRDQTAALPSFGTFATRLSAQPLRRLLSNSSSQEGSQVSQRPADGQQASASSSRG